MNDVRNNVSAVVVSYNSAPYLPDALGSLVANDVTAIVVDNASRDQSRLVAARHATTVIAQPNNRGFGAACNRGVVATTTPFVALLNPDATLPAGSLATAAQYLREHPRVGIVGFLLCDADGQPERHSFGTPVTWWTLLVRRFPRHNFPSPTGVLPCGWVSTGAAVLRKEAFDAVGGFDEGFFMYWEDVDLCQRLREAGWGVVLDPSVRVRHQRGASLADLVVKTALYDASADRYFRKHYAAMICWLLLRSRRLYRFFSPLVH